MNAIRRAIRVAGVGAVIAAVLAAPTAAAADIDIRRDGSKAVDAPADPHASRNSVPPDAFDLGDAGIGAAGMLALVLTSAGAASLRARRRPMRANEMGRA
jgi:hypothetical protein